MCEYTGFEHVDNTQWNGNDNDPEWPGKYVNIFRNQQRNEKKFLIVNKSQTFLFFSRGKLDSINIMLKTTSKLLQFIPYSRG